MSRSHSNERKNRIMKHDAAESICGTPPFFCPQKRIESVRSSAGKCFINSDDDRTVAYLADDSGSGRKPEGGKKPSPEPQRRPAAAVIEIHRSPLANRHI